MGKLRGLKSEERMEDQQPCLTPALPPKVGKSGLALLFGLRCHGFSVSPAFALALAIVLALGGPATALTLAGVLAFTGVFLCLVLVIFFSGVVRCWSLGVIASASLLGHIIGTCCGNETG